MNSAAFHAGSSAFFITFYHISLPFQRYWFSRCVLQHRHLKNTWMALLQDTDKRFKVIITVCVEKAAPSSSEFSAEIRNLDACKPQCVHIEDRCFQLITSDTTARLGQVYSSQLTTHLAAPTLGSCTIRINFLTERFCIISNLEHTHLLAFLCCIFLKLHHWISHEPWPHPGWFPLLCS